MKPEISLTELIPVIKKAGRIGLEGQKDVAFTYKDDGSVLTKYDMEINNFIFEEIKNRYPDANIVTEEAEAEFDPDKSYTFAVDPIDGTDAYTQGMPGWAVSIGLLDKTLKPVGGIIYAPKWGAPTGTGTLLYSDIHGTVTLNGRDLHLQAAVEDLSGLSQLMVSSRYHRDWNVKDFPGKLRNTGGAVLNIAGVILYNRIIAALVSPCHIWDLAAAHGILNNFGFRLEYISGKPINYQVMLKGENAEEYILAGTSAGIARTKAYISSFIPS